MRPKSIAFLTTAVLSILLLMDSTDGQRVQWKGEIEYKDGIKIIRNPKEPLFGEFTFELEEDLSIGNEEDENYMFFRVMGIQVDKQGNIFVLDSGNHRIQKFDRDGKYLLTIGKEGQGPGEFNYPMRISIDDKTGNVYVNDKLRKIKIFNGDGEYLDKDITFFEGLVDFYIDSDGNVLGKSFTPGTEAVLKILTGEKVEKRLAEFPYKNTQKHLGSSKVGNKTVSQGLWISHGYEHELHLSQIDRQTFIYGNSKDYELHVLSKDGDLFFKIVKDGPYKKFTASEKDRIEQRVKMDAVKRGKVLPDVSLYFPEHWPFFYSLSTDCKGRIYVRRNPVGRKEMGMRVYDIFSKDGYNLYKASISVYPYLIKNGFLYTRVLNEDTAEEFVKRFKIKNWDHIKDKKGD